MMTRYGTLQITFCSDTCFSMPAALDATIDAHVAADELGLPMAPGKTLHGLLRDTWLTVRDQLDTNQDGYKLLGATQSHAGEGLLRIGDARMDENTRAWVRWASKRTDNSDKPDKQISTAMLRQAFLGLRTLTSVNRETDAPKQDTLRMLRVVPAGTVLSAPLCLLAPAASDAQQQKEQQQELCDLLELLAQLTRHVGLDRNRGMGHVCIKVLWHEEKDTEAEKGQGKKPESPQTAVLPSGDSGQKIVFLPFRLRLTAPCLIADREVDVNSRASRPYLTGSALRGALAAALLRDGATEDELREILVSGTVRVLNAYLELEAKRALPAPITWQRVKDPTKEDQECIDKEDTTDLLRPLFASQETPDPEKPMTAFNNDFFADSGSSHYVPAKVAKRYYTHQQRERSTGIARKNRATVFVYEAIETDQSFRGCLALPAARPDLHTRLSRLLKEPLWLGRSIRSGYGGAPDVKLLAAAHNQGSETGFMPPAVEERELFSLRLTSDAVLRDPATGQHDPWQLHKAAQTHFKGLADVVTACVQAGTARGYNSLWRADLPEVPCVLAGSVVLLKAKVKLTSAELAAKQAVALGERGAEGKGCFVITKDTLSDDLPNLHVGKATDMGKVQEPQEADIAVEAVLKAAQRRLYANRLRMLLARGALEQAGDNREQSTNKAVVNLPSASLLQRVRGPLGDTEKWRNTYEKWFGPRGDHALKEKAREDLLKCRLKNEKLSDPKWHNQSLFDFLRQIAAENQPPIFPEEHAERNKHRMVPEALAETLWQEERRRLTVFYLDTLLSRLAKRARRAEVRTQIAHEQTSQEVANGHG